MTPAVPEELPGQIVTLQPQELVALEKFAEKIEAFKINTQAFTGALQETIEIPSARIQETREKILNDIEEIQGLMAEIESQVPQLYNAIKAQHMEFIEFGIENIIVPLDTAAQLSREDILEAQQLIPYIQRDIPRLEEIGKFAAEALKTGNIPTVSLYNKYTEKIEEVADLRINSSSPVRFSKEQQAKVISWLKSKEKATESVNFNELELQFRLILNSKGKLNPGEVNELIKQINQPKTILEEAGADLWIFKASSPISSPAAPETLRLVMDEVNELESKLGFKLAENGYEFFKRGSQGIILQETNDPGSLVKMFVLPGVTHDNILKLISINERLQQSGVPVIPMVKKELPGDRLGIEIVRIEGEPLGYVLSELNPGDWLTNPVAIKLQDEAFAILKKIDELSGGLADRRTRLLENIEDFSNFVVADVENIKSLNQKLAQKNLPQIALYPIQGLEGKTIVNIDPLNMAFVMKQNSVSSPFEAPMQADSTPAPVKNQRTAPMPYNTSSSNGNSPVPGPSGQGKNGGSASQNVPVLPIIIKGTASSAITPPALVGEVAPVTVFDKGIFALSMARSPGVFSATAILSIAGRGPEIDERTIENIGSLDANDSATEAGVRSPATGESRVSQGALKVGVARVGSGSVAARIEGARGVTRHNGAQGSGIAARPGVGAGSAISGTGDLGSATQESAKRLPNRHEIPVIFSGSGALPKVAGLFVSRPTISSPVIYRPSINKHSEKYDLLIEPRSNKVSFGKDAGLALKNGQFLYSVVIPAKGSKTLTLSAYDRKSGHLKPAAEQMAKEWLEKVSSYRPIASSPIEFDRREFIKVSAIGLGAALAVLAFPGSAFGIEPRYDLVIGSYTQKEYALEHQERMARLGYNVYLDGFKLEKTHYTRVVMDLKLTRAQLEAFKDKLITSKITTQEAFVIEKETFEARGTLADLYRSIEYTTSIPTNLIRSLIITESDERHFINKAKGIVNMSEDKAVGAGQITPIAVKEITRLSKFYERKERKHALKGAAYNRYRVIKSLVGDRVDEERLYKDMSYNIKVAAAVFFIYRDYFKGKVAAKEQESKVRLVSGVSGQGSLLLEQLTTAAYNLGPARVMSSFQKFGSQNWIKGVPTETLIHNIRFLSALQQLENKATDTDYQIRKIILVQALRDKGCNKLPKVKVAKVSTGSSSPATRVPVGKETDIMKAAQRIAAEFYQARTFPAPSHLSIALHARGVQQTAEILTDDEFILAAALLHRVPLDKLGRALKAHGFAKPAVERILYLVERMNTVSLLPYLPTADKQAIRNQIQAVIQLAETPEVMLLVLADKIQTIQTAIGRNDKNYFAREIYHIYSTIAKKINIKSLARIMDDEAFKISEEGNYKQTEAQIKIALNGMSRETAEEYLAKKVKIVPALLEKSTVPLEGVLVEFRVKGAKSAFDKTREEKDESGKIKYPTIDKLPDLFGVYIIAPGNAWEVLASLPYIQIGSVPLAEHQYIEDLKKAKAESKYWKDRKNGNRIVGERTDMSFTGTGDGLKYEVQVLDKKTYEEMQFGKFNHAEYKLEIKTKQKLGLPIVPITTDTSANFNKVYESLQSEIVVFYREKNKESLGSLRFAPGASVQDVAEALHINVAKKKKLIVTVVNPGDYCVSFTDKSVKLHITKKLERNGGYKLQTGQLVEFNKASSPAAASPAGSLEQEIELYKYVSDYAKEEPAREGVLHFETRKGEKSFIELKTAEMVRVPKESEPLAIYSVKEGHIILIKNMQPGERLAAETLVSCVGFALAGHTRDGSSLYGVGHLLAIDGENLDYLKAQADELIEKLTTLGVNKLEIVLYYHSDYEKSQKIKFINEFKANLENKFIAVNIIDEGVRGIRYTAGELVSSREWGIFRAVLPGKEDWKYNIKPWSVAAAKPVKLDENKVREALRILLGAEFNRKSAFAPGPQLYAAIANIASRLNLDPKIGKLGGASEELRIIEKIAYEVIVEIQTSKVIVARTNQKTNAPAAPVTKEDAANTQSNSQPANGSNGKAKAGSSPAIILNNTASQPQLNEIDTVNTAILTQAQQAALLAAGYHGPPQKNAQGRFSAISIILNALPKQASILFNQINNYFTQPQVLISTVAGILGSLAANVVNGDLTERPSSRELTPSFVGAPITTVSEKLTGLTTHLTRPFVLILTVAGISGSTAFVDDKGSVMALLQGLTPIAALISTLTGGVSCVLTTTIWNSLISSLTTLTEPYTALPALMAAAGSLHSSSPNALSSRPETTGWNLTQRLLTPLKNALRLPTDVSQPTEQRGSSSNVSGEPSSSLASSPAITDIFVGDFLTTAISFGLAGTAGLVAVQ